MLTIVGGAIVSFEVYVMTGSGWENQRSVGAVLNVPIFPISLLQISDPDGVITGTITVQYQWRGSPANTIGLDETGNLSINISNIPGTTMAQYVADTLVDATAIGIVLTADDTPRIVPGVTMDSNYCYRV